MSRIRKSLTGAAVALAVLGLSCILLIYAPAKLTASQSKATSSKTIARPRAVEISLTTSVAGGHKLCSAIWPGHFRDTLQMPDGASQATCIAWMNDIAATTYQQGCVFSDGSISLGPAGGGVPTPNCG